MVAEKKNFCLVWNYKDLGNAGALNIWAASWQKQRNAFPTSMDRDQPVHPRSLIRIHAVWLPTLLQVEKLIENSMDPDQIIYMAVDSFLKEG
jgi:hypothetical protein